VSVGGSPDSGWLHETRPEQAHPTTTPGQPRTRPSAAQPPKANRSGKVWAAALGVLMLVFVGLGGYDLFANRHLLGAKPVTAPAASATRRVAAGSPSARSASRASASATATASGSPPARSSPTVAPLQVLSAVSAVAVGPDGTSDGDNPGSASRVLVSDGVDAWKSSWYETAEFGNLQTGTGLLLDMGSRVSVSSVHLKLGAASGADVQVRLGDTSELGDLSTAASAYDVGGAVRLAPQQPVRARYVLVWFTLLPPDGAGTYQVSVYSITVDGRS
jgi:hypothetical protein